VSEVTRIELKIELGVWKLRGRVESICRGVGSLMTEAKQGISAKRNEGYGHWVLARKESIQ
jgi:hypothetical protein